jgi:hypothetical protein
LHAFAWFFLLQIGGGAGGAGGEGGDKLQVILKSINLLADQAQQPAAQFLNHLFLYMEKLREETKAMVVISNLNGSQLGRTEGEAILC